MTTYLELRRTALQPERFSATEYISDVYLSWPHAREITNISWQSEPMLADDLAQLLASRGWHQTDIGDELDEARKFTGPEA